MHFSNEPLQHFPLVYRQLTHFQLCVAAFIEGAARSPGGSFYTPDEVFTPRDAEALNEIARNASVGVFQTNRSRESTAGPLDVAVAECAKWAKDSEPRLVLARLLTSLKAAMAQPYEKEQARSLLRQIEEVPGLLATFRRIYFGDSPEEHLTLTAHQETLYARYLELAENQVNPDFLQMSVLG